MKEIKEVIEITKFQANDGKIFDTEIKALLHDKVLKGDVKYCEKCHGRGVYRDYDQMYGPFGGDRDFKCEVCKGKGYLEKGWI